MAISEAARRNHEELFPGHVSTLAQTDPELIEVFDNFAFDQVLGEGRLDARTRLMVQLASLIACQALAEYRVMLGAALTVGVTPVEAKEVLYQAVPYVGMAKVLDFLHATNDVLTDRGLQLPLEKMYASSPPGTLHIQRFLSENCFGDHLTRTGLDLAMRELVTFAMLISLGGCEPQVKGHALNALRVLDEATLS
jgi:4-carboxymuconolactone decarboxylase